MADYYGWLQQLPVSHSTTTNSSPLGTTTATTVNNVF